MDLTFASHLAEVAAAAEIACSPKYPDFVCSTCGRSIGAHLRNGEQTVGEGYLIPGKTGWWEHPGECYRCLEKRHGKTVAKARATVRELSDVDVPALARQLAKLPVFVDSAHPVGRIGVKVVYSGSRGGGRAKVTGKRRIMVRVSPGSDRANILETTLHELVHAALPSTVGHGIRFRLTLARAAREAWGVQVENVSPSGDGGRLSAYVLDDHIEAALKEKIKRGEISYPRRERPVKKPRAERLAELVDKRAAHAAKMLAASEAKLKRAQRSTKKWREKVRYYERQAAKRGSS